LQHTTTVDLNLNETTEADLNIDTNNNSNVNLNTAQQAHKTGARMELAVIALDKHGRYSTVDDAKLLLFMTFVLLQTWSCLARF
jgi:hypothetical protein